MKVAEELRKTLPGGRKRLVAADGLFHEWYEHEGKVYDLFANQYVRPGLWTPEELSETGLTQAVETGIFTPEQHKAFLDKLLRLKSELTED